MRRKSLNRGIKPIRKTPKERIDVWNALATDNEQVLRDFFHHGGNPHIKMGRTSLLGQAIACKARRCVRCIADNLDPSDRADAELLAGGIRCACANADVEILSMLILAGGDPFKPDHYGQIALHWCSLSGSVECADIVYSYDATLKECRGSCPIGTPYLMAFFSRQWPLAEWLAQKRTPNADEIRIIREMSRSGFSIP